jgi:hypothetical protein
MSFDPRVQPVVPSFSAGQPIPLTAAEDPVQ